MPAALLPIGLAVLMLVVGLRLAPAGLAGVIRRPKALIVGLAVQMGALPLLALAIAWLLALPPAAAAGLLVVAVAPGGITSNYVALAAGADLALSTAMTLITSLAAAVTIPLVLALGGPLVGLGAADDGGLALLRSAAAMVLVTALPLALGMAIARLAPAAVSRADRALRLMSGLVFAAIVLATFWDNRAAMAAHAATVGPAAALLNLGAIATAFAAAALARLGRRQGLAIAIETGLQNVALAIVVATSLLGRAELTTPVLVYAVVMNLSAPALLAVGRRQVRSGRNGPGRRRHRAGQRRGRPAAEGLPLVAVMTDTAVATARCAGCLAGLRNGRPTSAVSRGGLVGGAGPPKQARIRVRPDGESSCVRANGGGCRQENISWRRQWISGD